LTPGAGALKKLTLQAAFLLLVWEQNEKSDRRCFQEKSNRYCVHCGRSNHHRNPNICFCSNQTCVRAWHHGGTRTAYLEK
jgi:hypothetical protein